MGNRKDRNLWQCAELFRRTCPKHNDPAMKKVVVLIHESLLIVTSEAVREAKALCMSCPSFVRGVDLTPVSKTSGKSVMM